MCYRKFGGNIDSQYTHFSSMFSAGSLALLAHDETDGDRGEQAGDIVTIGRTLCRAVRLSELSLHDFAGSAQSGVVPQEFSGSGIPGTARQVETIECQTQTSSSRTPGTMTTQPSLMPSKPWQSALSRRRAASRYSGEYNYCRSAHK
jgi:hypothetical protein|eukprot:COSAG06_NODE_1411_length_9546_cov_8.730602_9_plen_147_part_00